MIDINELRRLALDGDLAAMQEIVLRLEAAEKERDNANAAAAGVALHAGAIQDRLEAAEKSDAESIAMYRKARDERDTLRAKIETAENDAAHQKALAASALRVAKGWERKCGELRAEVIYWKEQKEPGAAGWRALARILQAKIDAMEQQEPIGGMLEVSPHNYELRWYRPVPFGTKLYTLPGAKGE